MNYKVDLTLSVIIDLAQVFINCTGTFFPSQLKLKIKLPLQALSPYSPSASGKEKKKETDEREIWLSIYTPRDALIHQNSRRLSIASLTQ